MAPTSTAALHLRVWRRKRDLPTGAGVVRVHGGIHKLSMGIIKRGIARVVVRIGLLRSTLGALGFLFANAMDTRTRVDMLVDRPVRALSTISEWSWNLLEAWVER